MARHNVSIDITQAAADWLNQIESGMTAAQRQAFAHWLRRSPVHVEEFLQISELRREVSGALHRHPEWVTELTEQTLSNVIDLPPGSAGDDADLPGDPAGPHRGWMAVAAVLVVMVFAVWMVQAPDRITTELGEQRTVALSDGSTLTVNTDSSVEIAITSATRELTLMRGELLVNVATDAARPFRVLSGDTIIEAIGTSFAVRRLHENTVVTVVEGVVRLTRESFTPGPDSSLPASRAPMDLRAGSKATLAQRGAIEKPVEVEPVQVARATAWLGRRLDFDAETVATVIDEFNRYNPTTLTVEDQYLASRRISGVFNVNDPDAFVALLAELEPISIEIQGNERRLLRRKVE